MAYLMVPYLILAFDESLSGVYPSEEENTESKFNNPKQT